MTNCFRTDHDAALTKRVKGVSDYCDEFYRAFQGPGGYLGISQMIDHKGALEVYWESAEQFKKFRWLPEMMWAMKANENRWNVSHHIVALLADSEPERGAKQWL